VTGGSSHRPGPAHAPGSPIVMPNGSSHRPTRSSPSVTIGASRGRPPTERHSSPSIQQGKRDDPTATPSVTGGSSQQDKRAEQALRSVRRMLLRTDRHAAPLAAVCSTVRHPPTARGYVRDAPVVPRRGVRGEDPPPGLAAAMLALGFVVQLGRDARRSSANVRLPATARVQAASPFALDGLIGTTLGRPLAVVGGGTRLRRVLLRWQAPQPCRFPARFHGRLGG
jgi:hypothetical protein